MGKFIGGNMTETNQQAEMNVPLTTEQKLTISQLARKHLMLSNQVNEMAAALRTELEKIAQTNNIQPNMILDDDLNLVPANV
jgi:hypothetical protein